jgi:hypothetical protein
VPDEALGDVPEPLRFAADQLPASQAAKSREVPP